MEVERQAEADWQEEQLEGEEGELRRRRAPIRGI